MAGGNGLAARGRVESGRAWLQTSRGGLTCGGVSARGRRSAVGIGVIVVQVVGVLCARGLWLRLVDLVSRRVGRMRLLLGRGALVMMLWMNDARGSRML